MTDLPVIGVDVSRYEVNDIRDDLGKLMYVKSFWSPDKATKPIDFVFQRLSYGGKLDEFLDLLYPEVLKVPVRCAYHYYSSGVKWQTQVDIFLGAADGKSFHFFMLDYEKLFNNLNGTTFAESQQIITQLKIETKKPVLDYFNQDVYKTYMKPFNADAIINQQDLCVAQYPFTAFLNLAGGPPKPAGITKDPEFWQYGAADVPMTAGYTAGFDYGSWRHGIDLIKWHSTLDALHSYAAVDGTEPPATEPPPPQGYAGGTITLTLAPDGKISASNWR